MPYSPKCIDFAPILLYTYLVDPVSLKLFAAGATFWVLKSIFGENFGFLLQFSGLFSTPSIPQLGLEPQLGGAQPTAHTPGRSIPE